MLQKKVCVLGAFGVGKTSLVRRYVESIFSDAYLTTVGVKIDKKTLTVGTEPLTLILWDIAGEDEVNAVRMSYVRGAAGYFLVADGTRAETLHRRAARSRLGSWLKSVPFPSCSCSTRPICRRAGTSRETRSTRWNSAGWVVLRTSAKTGEGVEEAFQGLAQRLVS